MVRTWAGARRSVRAINRRLRIRNRLEVDDTAIDAALAYAIEAEHRLLNAPVEVRYVDECGVCFVWLTPLDARPGWPHDHSEIVLAFDECGVATLTAPLFTDLPAVIASVAIAAT